MLSKPIRNAARVLLLFAAGAALVALLAPADTAPGPYVSALSDLAATPAHAAGCSDRFCNRNVSCKAGGLGSSCKNSGGGCETIPC